MDGWTAAASSSSTRSLLAPSASISNRHKLNNFHFDNNNNNNNNDNNNDNSIKIEKREKEKIESHNKTDNSLLFLENKNKNDIEILEKSSTNIFHEISTLNKIEDNFVERNEKMENKKVEISSQIIKKSESLNNFNIDYDFRKNKKEVNLIPHLKNNFQFQEGPSPFLLLHILVSIVSITVNASFFSSSLLFLPSSFLPSFLPFFFSFFECEKCPNYSII